MAPLSDFWRRLCGEEHWPAVAGGEVAGVQSASRLGVPRPGPRRTGAIFFLPLSHLLVINLSLFFFDFTSARWWRCNLKGIGGVLHCVDEVQQGVPRHVGLFVYDVADELAFRVDNPHGRPQCSAPLHQAADVLD